MPVNRSIEEEKFAVADNFGDDFDVDARPEQAKTTAPSAASVGSGWEAAEKLHTPAGDYPVDYKSSETIQVVKFIDPNGPFATYKQHFLNKRTEGKRSFVCSANEPQGCPLCTMLGDKPEEKRGFTIVNLSANPMQRQILTATPRFFKTLHAAHFSPQGPLDRHYWALSRTGQKQTTVYHMNAIKGRDLQEDWGIVEADAETAVASFEPYDNTVIRMTPYADLVAIAEELL